MGAIGDAPGEDYRHEQEAWLEKIQFLSDAMESTSQPFCAAGRDGSILIFNEAFCRLTGYTREELYSISWITKLTTRESLENELKALEILDRTHKPQRYEKCYRRKDGTVIPVELLVDLSADSKGHPLFYYAFITDITERKRKEERLLLTQFAVDHFTDSSIWLDYSGRITYVNDATCMSTGYDKNELLSMYIWDIDPEYSPEIYAREWRNWDETRGQHKQNRFESVHRTKSGKVFPVEITGNIFVFSGQKYFVTYDRDITERKQAEEDMKTAKAQAELYLDLMGHDINNMHQIALGYLEMARDMSLEASQAEILDKSIKVLQRSTQLISNVSKLQKLKEGVFPSQVIDVCEVLVEVQREFGAVPNKTITLDFSRCGHCYTRSNELLHDVFANLVSNAIKHTGGSANISISLDRIEDKGSHYCRVSVEDNGTGIPDDLKPRIFNRMIKGVSKAKGMGLGLYLVKTLVDSYDGRVWVEDRVPGDHTKGARFIVTLPTVYK